MSDLEQAKRRNRKVYITDIAIEKVAKCSEVGLYYR